MKTAVKWYAEQAMKLELEKAKGNISITEMLNQLSDILNQALEIEKEQIVNSYIDGSFTGCGCYDFMEKEDGEKYYKEIFQL